MLKGIHRLCAVALLAALSLPVHAATSPLADAMAALDTAVRHASVDEMLAARAAFTALVADEPGSAHNQYGLALADWRVVPLMGSARAELARKLCKDGIAACDRAIAADPKFADAIALRAGLQGVAISFVPGAAMALGAEIIEQNARARGMAPANPRVQLLAAISVLHQPAFAGGGPELAKPAFERAIALYEAAPGSDTTDIAWGRADAYLWSGRCLSALGDWAGARGRYRHVLEIAPDHEWTLHTLLPEAEAKLAAGSAH